MQTSWGALADHAKRNMPSNDDEDDEDDDPSKVMHQRLHKFLAGNTSESEKVARLERNLAGANAARKQEMRELVEAGKQAMAAKRQEMLREEARREKEVRRCSALSPSVRRASM